MPPPPPTPPPAPPPPPPPSPEPSPPPPPSRPLERRQRRHRCRHQSSRHRRGVLRRALRRLLLHLDGRLRRRISPTWTTTDALAQRSATVRRLTAPLCPICVSVAVTVAAQEARLRPFGVSQSGGEAARVLEVVVDMRLRRRARRGRRWVTTDGAHPPRLSSRGDERAAREPPIRRGKLNDGTADGAGAGGLSSLALPAICDSPTPPPSPLVAVDGPGASTLQFSTASECSRLSLGHFLH